MNTTRIANRITILATALLLLTGCTPKWVADYDARMLEAILATAKQVDGFYGNLLIAPEDTRPFDQFAEAYVAIEVELRSLVTRNEIRPLNSESTRIATTALEQWQQYLSRHREKDGYATRVAELHRKNMQRLLTAMAKAEQARKYAGEADDE